MNLRVFGALLVAASAVFAQSPSRFRAGAFAADITPRQWPVRLIGGFEPPLSEKANDPLHARALVFDDGAAKVAIVVADSCYMPRVLLDRAKSRATQATGIPSTNILMSATHTHSAPPSKSDGASAVELAYQALLEEQLARAVIEADRKLQPAEIGIVVRQEAEALNNRRWFMTPGSIPPDPFGGTTDKVKMNPPRASKDLIRPAGPVDPGFSLVCVRTVAGKPLALLANYSLHYVGGAGGLQVSADYFGEFARQAAARLEAEGAGTEFVAILSNGTSGDVNNIDFRKPAERLAPFEKIRQVAGKLADSAFAGWREAKFRREAKIAMAERELPLKYRKPSPELLEKTAPFLRATDESKLPPHAKAYALRIRKLYEGPDWADVKLQALRIGDLGIAAIPCEVFTETGLAIKKQSPLRTTFTIELANGHYGYLPTPEQHELGGYETWMGTNLLEKQAAPKITAALLEMFGALARKN